jgi:uncharacterized lipoprotein NlpE involved in copper resistance
VSDRTLCDGIGTKSNFYSQKSITATAMPAVGCAYAYFKKCDGYAMHAAGIASLVFADLKLAAVEVLQGC